MKEGCRNTVRLCWYALVQVMMQTLQILQSLVHILYGLIMFDNWEMDGGGGGGGGHLTLLHERVRASLSHISWSSEELDTTACYQIYITSRKCMMQLLCDLCHTIFTTCAFIFIIIHEIFMSPIHFYSCFFFTTGTVEKTSKKRVCQLCCIIPFGKRIGNFVKRRGDSAGHTVFLPGSLDRSTVQL
jgi:hypothetical protein